MDALELSSKDSAANSIRLIVAASVDFSIDGIEARRLSVFASRFEGLSLPVKALLVRNFVEEIAGSLITCSNSGIEGGGGTDLLERLKNFGVWSAFVVFRGAERFGGGGGRTFNVF